MEKFGFNLDNGSSTGDPKQTNPQESRRLAIQDCIQSLLHACQCRDANCRLPSCQKMKRVVQHAKSCKRKTNGGCPICKQLIALCYYHAKHCQEANCPVPFCLNIKRKLRLPQLEQRLQQLYKRRKATMLNRELRGTVPQPNRGNSDTCSQPSPSSLSHTSPHPPQPSIGMKPFTGPPVGTLLTVQQVQGLPAPGPTPSIARPSQALHQLLQTLKSPASPQQQQQVLHILKSNPQLMAAFIKQRTAQQQQQQMMINANSSNQPSANVPPQPESQTFSAEAISPAWPDRTTTYGHVMLTMETNAATALLVPHTEQNELVENLSRLHPEDYHCSYNS